MLLSNGLDGIKNEPRCESGDINKLLITQMRPGSDKLKRSQNVIFYLMLLRMVSKFPIHKAGSADMFIPKILVSVQRVNPRSLTWSGTGIILPICKMAVFSMLQRRPLKEAKLTSTFFNARRLLCSNKVATLVSSANPSALSVAQFDSAQKRGLFSCSIASFIEGCGTL